MQEITVFWFRRDLRLNDNCGLYHALKSGLPVLPVFIFDLEILEDLSDRKDARVGFIHQSILALQKELVQNGSNLIVKTGRPLEIWKQLVSEFRIRSVFYNRDYEPYARQRDDTVQRYLHSQNIEVQDFKDHVIFDKDEISKADGSPYTVFTPYSRRWKERFAQEEWNPANIEPNGLNETSSFPSETLAKNFLRQKPLPIPTLQDIGFEKSDREIPPKFVTRDLIRRYHQTRDFPFLKGTSRLGIHFRFGTISIREKARKAAQLNETYLKELIWRDFYSMILWHFPRVIGHPFKNNFDHISWRNDPKEYKKWCTGRTGYPLVDAGMRELNATGYMHNRVRMVTASFLAKHLLIDWRWGEAYFAERLLDFDLASNNGGWQWAAGCGTDAAPYFRIFNPEEQQKKFDPAFMYVKKWVPEFGLPSYPRPMVEHQFARKRCLETYAKALKAVY